MSETFSLIIEPKSDDFDSNDERWLEQVNDLLVACQEDAGDISRREVVQEGKKGVIQDIVLSIAPEAMQAAVNVFTAWLNRDKTRSLKLKISEGESTREYEVSGKGIKQDKIEEFMKLALEQQQKPS